MYNITRVYAYIDFSYVRVYVPAVDNKSSRSDPPEQLASVHIAISSVISRQYPV